MLSTSSYPAIMVAIIKLSTCDVLVLLTFDRRPGMMPLVLVDEVKLKGKDDCFMLRIDIIIIVTRESEIPWMF